MKVAHDLSKTGRTAKVGYGEDVEFSEKLSISLGTQLYIPCGNEIVLTPTKLIISGESSVNLEYREWKKTKGVFEDCLLKNLCGEAASRSLFTGYFCIDCICNNYRDNQRKLLHIKNLADKKYRTNAIIIQAVKEGEIKKIERKSTKPVLKSVNLPTETDKKTDKERIAKPVVKPVSQSVKKIDNEKVEKDLRATGPPKKENEKAESFERFGISKFLYHKKPEGGEIMVTGRNTYYYEKQTAAVNLGKETIVIISLLGAGNQDKRTDESIKQWLAWYDSEARKENCILFKTCGLIVDALELPRHWCCGSCPFQDFTPERQAGLGEKLKKLFSDSGKIKEAEDEGVIVLSPHDLNGRIIWSMSEDVDEQKKDGKQDELVYRIVKNEQMDLNKHSAEQVLKIYDNLIIKGTFRSVRIVRKIDDKFASIDVEELRRMITAEKQESALIAQKNCKDGQAAPLTGHKCEQQGVADIVNNPGTPDNENHSPELSPTDDKGKKSSEEVVDQAVSGKVDSFDASIEQASFKEKEIVVVNSGMDIGLVESLKLQGVEFTHPDGIYQAMIPIDMIDPNKDQPRTFFDQDSLVLLSETLKSQDDQYAKNRNPIVVTQRFHPEKGVYRFLIEDGERRWRAAKQANVKKIYCIVIPECGDLDLLVNSCLANWCRETLNMWDSARSFKAIMKNAGWTVAKVAEKTGLHIGTVHNALKLLKLHPDLQNELDSHTLDPGLAGYFNSYPIVNQKQMLDRCREKGILPSDGKKVEATSRRKKVGFIAFSRSLKEVAKELGVVIKSRRAMSLEDTVLNALQRTVMNFKKEQEEFLGLNPDDIKNVKKVSLSGILEIMKEANTFTGQSIALINKTLGLSSVDVAEEVIKNEDKHPDYSLDSQIKEPNSGSSQDVKQNNQTYPIIHLSGPSHEQRMFEALMAAFDEASLGVAEAQIPGAWKSGLPELNGSEDCFLCVEQIGRTANSLYEMTAADIIKRHNANKDFHLPVKLWHFKLSSAQLLAYLRAKRQRDTQSTNTAFEKMMQGN